ncbi:MAG: menaquinone reductase multiheme cytochrome c subunit QrcA [Desulfatiglandales bacterium]
MKDKKAPSDKSSKGGWIHTLVHVALSYYSELISHPLRSGLVYFVVGLVPALIIGWLLFPMALYSKQAQPIEFSHAIHTLPDIGIEGETEVERCIYCHEFRDDGTFSGIPTLAKCMECHDDPNSPLGEEPEEERFLKQYVAGKEEIPWSIYYRQPDCVYFSHIAHVKMGNLDCGNCHGDHGKSEKLPLYRENRLTGYSINIWGKNIAGYKSNPWDRMKMDDCAECHTDKGQEQNNACFVCHK